jgi:hypothetical protein
MKVIIAGSRSINDYKQLCQIMDNLIIQTTEVVCGMASGVDLMGKRWAEENGIPVKKMPANWSLHGNAAGPIRNKEMAEYADALILLWDGKSKGSKSMLKFAKENDLYIHEVII